MDIFLAAMLRHSLGDANDHNTDENGILMMYEDCPKGVLCIRQTHEISFKDPKRKCHL